MHPIKILIIRLSSMGDIVLTSPVVRCLKQQLAQVEIHFCTKEQYHDLLAHNPYIDKIHLLNGCIKNTIKRLQAENFDYVIDLHNNFRSFRIKMALNKPHKTLKKLNVQKWLYVNTKINWMPKTHIVDRYMQTVAFLGVQNDHQGLDYFITPHHEVPLSEFPVLFQQGYAAFVIGGGHYTKRLPIEKVLEFCIQIPMPIILLGGKEEMATAKHVMEALYQTHPQVAERVYNACGEYSVNQAASVVRQSQVVFTHDTGLMHIAAAYKKFIYAIWGNTTPALGMYPYKTSFVSIENLTLNCRPCSKIGYNQCPKGHFKCMLGLRLPKKLVSLPLEQQITYTPQHESMTLPHETQQTTSLRLGVSQSRTNTW
ncbi:glycosyltransferase family 9 protein [Eisenibacter elegans]|uniref:glycosyltransferase family 9 protein n=1 Tax=Eisenibacter elegans TaxID=997 RepID=UPI0009D6A558|nr:glycosyltransferase family 9 protein [Eisenibacter elegans]